MDYVYSEREGEKKDRFAIACIFVGIEKINGRTLLS